MRCAFLTFVQMDTMMKKASTRVDSFKNPRRSFHDSVCYYIGTMELITILNFTLAFPFIFKFKLGNFWFYSTQISWMNKNDYYLFQNRRRVIVSWIIREWEQLSRSGFRYCVVKTGVRNDMWKKIQIGLRGISGKSLQNRRAKDRRHDGFLVWTSAFDVQESSLHC
jgi:hypothetical protein